MPNKQRKRSPKICMVNCQWENCQWRLDIEPSEYDILSDHLKAHADEFISRLRNDADWQEDKPVACCCMWRGCAWEGCGDFMELLRHIMCHGYHVLLKSLGKLVQSKMKLATCRIEMEDPYNVLSSSSTFTCQWDGCQTEYFCPNKFYRHVEKHGLESTPLGDETTELKMKCSWATCSNQFRDKYKLKEHLRVHTHEKLIACPDCGGMFSNQTKLLDHLSRQNPEAYENFQCSHCLKRCASERLLRDHQRHHVNYLKCPHCDMTCPNPGSLKYHITYRHTDERPFSCAMCEQSFKSHSDLVRHEESHLEKSYICDMEDCFYSTKTQHCLRRHIRIVHSNSEKRYVCHICNNAYSRGFGLTKHLKKKHNFSWPSGHPRFRYIQYEDGFYRLQMVRFESVELTKRLQVNGEDGEEEGEEEEVADDAGDTVQGIPEYDGDNNLGHYDGNTNGDKIILMEEGVTHYGEEEGECIENCIEYNGDNEDDDDKFAVKLHGDDVLYTNVAFQNDETKDNTITGNSTFLFPSPTTTVMKPVKKIPPKTDLNTFCGLLTMPADSLILQPKPAGYEKTVMAQLLELGKKQNHDSSTVESAIVADLYQRLKSEMNKNKTPMRAGEGVFTQTPEVAAHETLVTDYQTVFSPRGGKRKTLDGCFENEAEKRTKLMGDSLNEDEEQEDGPCLQELVENSNDCHDFVEQAGQEIEEMVASRVLLSLNGEIS